MRLLPFSDEITKKVARRAHPTIPSCSHEVLNFSDKWVRNFKKRFQIKAGMSHGDALSVPPLAHMQMDEMRKLISSYDKNNIYNMDEAGLFYRQNCQYGLSTGEQRGVKADEVRVSLAVCCNATGSDKVPIMMINSAVEPRDLTSAELNSPSWWHASSKKARMNSSIMRMWLKRFQHHVGSSRKILLLMDSSSAHSKAVEIRFLPPNAASVFRPLDQGIIAHLKFHYKKKVLQCNIDYLIWAGVLPKITRSNCINWLNQSWHEDVEPTTIHNCFTKAREYHEDGVGRDVNMPLSAISSRLEQIARLQNLDQVPSAESFLNPPDENEGDEPGSDKLANTSVQLAFTNTQEMEADFDSMLIVLEDEEECPEDDTPEEYMPPKIDAEDVRKGIITLGKYFTLEPIDTTRYTEALKLMHYYFVSHPIGSSMSQGTLDSSLAGDRVVTQPRTDLSVASTTAHITID